MSIYQATLAEQNQRTPEISTDEMRRILADGSAIVIDARKYQEFVNGHILGVKSTMLEIGEPPADVVVPVVLNIVGGDKSKAIVLYCDGPKCMASRKLGGQLVDERFTNVRRYQLGVPMWRLVGGPVAIELEGFRRVDKLDRPAVFFDARSAEDFSKQNLGMTHNIPVDKLTAINRNMPLPMNDAVVRSWGLSGAIWGLRGAILLDPSLFGFGPKADPIRQGRCKVGSDALISVRSIYHVITISKRVRAIHEMGTRWVHDRRANPA